jgi:uncharacterized protein DUF6159
MKKCPNCTSLMPEDVTRCIRCGFDSPPKMTEAAAGTSLVAPKPAPAKKGRIASGFALARECCRVLWTDKQLLVFPLVSGIASFVVLASFIGVGWASSEVVADAQGNMHVQPTNDDLFWVLCGGFYFLNYFVIVFFNVALVGCAMTRFRGGTPTLADGLRLARERLPQIAAWALLAASVGVALRVIEQRIGIIGKIVVAILGAAWTVATYFVVPVLVAEKIGPLDAARRSAAVVKKAWGESLVSNVGIGALTMLVTILSLVLIGIGSLMAALKLASIVPLIAGLVLAVVFIVVASLVGSALSSIALCALYLYATEGKVPRAFADTGLQNAFAARA